MDRAALADFLRRHRAGLRPWFTDPDARRLYPPDDRPRQSRAQVATLRAALAMLGPRSRAGELVGVLSGRSPEFAGLWELHEVGRRFAEALLVLTAAPRSETERRPELLRVIGSEQFSAG